MSSIEQDYCCKVMDYYADPDYSKQHELIRYHSEARDYRFLLHGLNAGLEQPIIYCPWCGKKLPESLGKEWCKVMKEEFDLDDVFAEEWEQLPDEYKTDAWWRKRDL